MCGIIGYIGNKLAAPILLEGLFKLEYRGYDSAGIAVKDNKISIYKAKGKVRSLARKINGGKNIRGFAGIGHTRWATHGRVNLANAHPHSSGADNNIVLVHNGVIENYLILKDELIKAGYKFYSETDTEIIAKLVDYFFKLYNDPMVALRNLINELNGTFALGILFKNSDALYAVRKGSSLFVGKNDGESFIASDLQTLSYFTDAIYIVGDDEIVELKEKHIRFFDKNLNCFEKEKVNLDLKLSNVDKGKYPYFMLKEIHEQPYVIRDTISFLLEEISYIFNEIRDKVKSFNNIKQINMVACGSSYNSACVTKFVLENISSISINVSLASEFRFKENNKNDKDSLIILISQSGETADCLTVLREAKNKDIMTLAIVNVSGTMLDLEAEYVLHTKAGCEISVATTKVYSAQLVAGYLFSVYFAYERGEITKDKLSYYVEHVKRLPKSIEQILSAEDAFKRLAYKYRKIKNVFFIGRSVDYAVCLEGALKLKEVSYIHAEACAAGEFKHGTISLVDKRYLVIAILTQEDIANKTIINLHEIKSRGANVVLLLNEKISLNITDLPFEVYTIPSGDDLFMASIACVPLQIIAYYIGVSKGIDVDRPRHLAKSVVVE